MKMRTAPMTFAIFTIAFYPVTQLHAATASILDASQAKQTNQAKQTIQAPIQQSTAQTTLAKREVAGVSHIRFERGEQAEARVILDLSDPHVPIDLQYDEQKITARILNQPLTTQLIQRLNVQDFATLVQYIDSYNAAGHGVVEIQGNADFDYTAYQADKQLIIRIKPKTQQTDHSASYHGKSISLDFQDIEVRRVLQVLAEFSGFNLVASDAVQGNITLNLKQVPWDEALDLILSSKGLDKRIKGSTYLIAPTTELIKSDEESAKLLAQSVQVAPIQTEYIALKYAKAADIVALIRDTGNASGEMQKSESRTATEHEAGSKDQRPVKSLNDQQGSLLSPRGRVSLDQRTNTLIVSDTNAKIEQIRKMIDLLDVPVKQVMIEARIVRANTDVSRDMGVKWGFLSRGRELHMGGSTNTLWDLRSPDGTSQGGQPNYTIRQNDYLNVDLGVSSAGASRIAFGVINISNTILDLELSALQADGAAEVISTPKVMTADKQKAKVASGQQIPYQTREQFNQGDRTMSTSFKDALLSMDVTPSITPDGNVQMMLNINNDSPAGTAPNGDLIINKNSIDTNVLVRNGETVVLGGVFEQDTRKRQTRVPILGQIPVLGRLFRRDEKSDKKSELLIFVTPRIVNDSYGRNH